MSQITHKELKEILFDWPSAFAPTHKEINQFIIDIQDIPCYLIPVRILESMDRTENRIIKDGQYWALPLEYFEGPGIYITDERPLTKNHDNDVSYYGADRRNRNIPNKNYSGFSGEEKFLAVEGYIHFPYSGGSLPTYIESLLLKELILDDS